MEKFAKLFETEEGQIVVLLIPAENGGKEIRFYFEPKQDYITVSNVSYVFNDTIESNAAARAKFDELSEADALEIKHFQESQLDFEGDNDWKV